jgi:hypothetical protein
VAEARETTAKPSVAELARRLIRFAIDTGQSEYLTGGSARGLLYVAAAAAADHEYHVTTQREDGTRALIGSAPTEPKADQLADRADRAHVHFSYVTKADQATAREILAFAAEPFRFGRSHTEEKRSSNA